MVVACCCLKHFFLPVGVAAAIVHIVEVVLLDIVADVLSRCHVEGVEGCVESHISRVSHIDTLLILLALLGCDDDHTIGSLRTVDGSCCCVAEHVDRLDIVWCNHRDVNAWDTINHIVWRHCSTATERRSTTESHAWTAVRVACCGYYETCYLTLKHRTSIGEYALVEVLCLDCSD